MQWFRLTVFPCWGWPLLSLAASYFDDELSLECICDANVSQRGLSAVFRLMGAPPQQPKAFSPAADRHFLGTSIHLGDALFSGFVRIQPKSATVAKVRSKLWDILESKVFPRDAASKLRGDLTWMFSMTAGHLGRLAGPVLTKYQTAENPELCSDDEFLLRLLVAVVERPVPRQVQVCGPCLLPVVIYTDASFEFSHLRLGWVLTVGVQWAGAVTFPQRLFLLGFLAVSRSSLGRL